MEKEIFYHIHEYENEEIEKEWFVGNIIEFSKQKYNSFMKISLEFKGTIPEVTTLQGEVVKNVPFLNAYKYFCDCKVIEQVPGLIHIASDFINEYQMLIRELAYEQIRLEYFPNLPSRFHCIWLCKEEQVEFWKKNLKSNCRIFKVEIDKNYFKSNNSAIALPSDSYLTIIKKAKEYWGYDELEENEQDEYLYEGKIKIIEELK